MLQIVLTSTPPMFVIVGLFLLVDGRQSRTIHCMSYDTTLAYLNSVPMPTVVHMLASTHDAVLQNGMVVFIVGKLYVLPPHTPQPIAIDTVEITPIPGNPSHTPVYQDHLPHYPILTIVTQGTIASATDSHSSTMLAYPLAISDYVCGTVQTTTITFILAGHPHHDDILTLRYTQMPLQ